jgi:hypothetical protein
MKRHFLPAIAPALLLVIGAPPASAQAVQTRTPIAFTLSGCTQLPAGLTVNGSGESFLVVTSRVDQDGNIVLQQNNLVTGTAVDSEGATYSFNYHNHSTITVPPAGLPVSISGADHFNLIGKGKADKLNVHFNATGTIFSFSPLIASIEFKTVHGNPAACDPI